MFAAWCEGEQKVDKGGRDFSFLFSFFLQASEKSIAAGGRDSVKDAETGVCVCVCGGSRVWRCACGGVRVWRCGGGEV